MDTFTPTTFFPSSPAPSSSSDDHEAGPSRKRARTDMTTEQRKEARAHRNRIAAQNSRDKRKAEFGALHQRVAELEAENARLRAGAHVVVAPAEPSPWDAENAALKERIRTLEKGWDVILKALAAQGLPTGLLGPDVVVPPSATPTTAAPPTATSTTSPPSPMITMMPASPLFPPTPTSLAPTFVLPSPVAHAAPELSESARHPARVATAARSRVASLQRADSSTRCRPSRARRVTVLRALRHLRLTRGWTA
jgi:cell division protein FtsB